MDNRFGDIETFLAVANGGSLASAARALRLTPSAVSRSVARLEQRLGVTLMRRTTRSLALTSDGEAYRDRMSILLADIQSVEAGLGQWFHDHDVARLLCLHASLLVHDCAQTQQRNQVDLRCANGRGHIDDATVAQWPNRAEGRFC